MDSLEARIERIVRCALDEDKAFTDLTTSLLVQEGIVGIGRIIARKAGIISGQLCAEASFRQLSPGIEYEAVAGDGDRVDEGSTVSEIRGSLAAILSAERTALNFLGHLSGIAGMTARYVEKVKECGAVILDTRKTTPGLREMEKMAVIHGGGGNHRRDLASYILVKENHIEAAGSIGKVVSMLGERISSSEIEVETLGQLELLSGSSPGRVLLDNFTPEMVEEAVSLVDSWEGRRPEIEVSGGINLDTVSRYAIRGVDFISVGSLTSSAGALDLSLLAKVAEV